MAQRSRRSVTATVLIGAACLGVGAATAALAVSAGAPDGLQDPPAASTIAVTLQPFNDARPVQLTLQQTPGLPLSTSLQGVVTASTCTAGGTITSGAVAWSIGGVGLLALHTHTPLYRDLRPGDSGADVAALTAELHRLDPSVPEAQTLTAADVAALNTLFTAGGSPPLPGPAVTVDRVVWIPRQTVSIATCQASMGARVVGPLATTAPVVTAAVLERPPAALLPGERVLVVDGTDFHLDHDPPAITDPDEVAALLKTPTGAAAAATMGSSTPVPLQASYSLAHPVQAATVPAGAVLGSAAATCVLDAAGMPHRIRVVDSGLGRSVVQFADGKTPNTVLISPSAAASCS